MNRRLLVGAGLVAALLCAQVQTEFERRHEGCLAVGPTGALECHDRTIDIVPSVVPRLMAANQFTGLNTFERGIVLATRERPRCTEELRGTFWFVHGPNKTKDSVQVCVYDGKETVWTPLF